MSRSVMRRLAGVRWTYDRRRTSLAVLVVATLGSALAWALVPEGWRPSSPAWIAVAALAAYVVLRLDAYAGLGKRFKHSVMDSFGGDVDDAQTWAVAAAAGASVLVVVAVVERLAG